MLKGMAKNYNFDMNKVGKEKFSLLNFIKCLSYLQINKFQIKKKHKPFENFSFELQ